MEDFVIATRRSQLALVQSEMIAAALKRALPNARTRLLPLQTTGDRFKQQQIESLGGKGVFTREIEDALLSGEANMAMHSLKDMPMEMPEGLMIAGVLPRNNPFDVLVSHAPLQQLADLPQGASIGTSSPRRAAQMQRLRPDLKIIPFRGNVPTRLKKVLDGKVDACLLAAAGLERLSLTPHHSCIMDAKAMLPAIGQGLIAIQCRADDTPMQQAIAAINCKKSWQQALAERALLKAIEGDCHRPLAGHAMWDKHAATLTVSAAVFSTDGAQYAEMHVTGPANQAQQLGAECGEKLKPKAVALWQHCS